MLMYGRLKKISRTLFEAVYSPIYASFEEQVFVGGRQSTYYTVYGNAWVLSGDAVADQG